jgi:hypothetical protein
VHNPDYTKNEENENTGDSNIYVCRTCMDFYVIGIGEMRKVYPDMLIQLSMVLNREYGISQRHTQIPL